MFIKAGYAVWEDIQPVKDRLGFSSKCLQYEDDNLTISTDISPILNYKKIETKNKIRRRDRKLSKCPKDLEIHHFYYSDKYDPDSFIICTPDEHAEIDSHRFLKNND